MSSVVCPDVPLDGCSVCGSNKCVTKPEATFSFPDQPSVLCDALQEAGYAGVVPLTQCPILPELVKGPCGCQDHATPAAAHFFPPTQPPDYNMKLLNASDATPLIAGMIFLGAFFLVMVPLSICGWTKYKGGESTKEAPEIVVATDDDSSKPSVMVSDTNSIS